MRRIEDILEVEEGARSECCGLFDCRIQENMDATVSGHNINPGFMLYLARLRNAKVRLALLAGPVRLPRLLRQLR